MNSNDDERTKARRQAEARAVVFWTTVWGTFILVLVLAAIAMPDGVK